jgi:hypothetical protein
MSWSPPHKDPCEVGTFQQHADSEAASLQRGLHLWQLPGDHGEDCVHKACVGARLQYAFVRVHAKGAHRLALPHRAGVQRVCGHANARGRLATVRAALAIALGTSWLHLDLYAIRHGTTVCRRVLRRKPLACRGARGSGALALHCRSRWLREAAVLQRHVDASAPAYASGYAR